VRFLKVSAVMAVVLALAASSVLAGSSCTASKSASAKSCSSELSAAFAGASNSCNVSKAKLASMVDIETTELPSGTLVVTYTGKTPEAVTYLQAACCGTAAEFCCPMTRKVAETDAKVEVARTKTGAMVLITSNDPAVTKQAAASYTQLASSGE
jgi:hypothetical protein